MSREEQNSRADAMEKAAGGVLAGHERAWKPILERATKARTPMRFVLDNVTKGPGAVFDVASFGLAEPDMRTRAAFGTLGSVAGAAAGGALGGLSAAGFGAPVGAALGSAFGSDLGERLYDDHKVMIDRHVERVMGPVDDDLRALHRKADDT